MVRNEGGFKVVDSFLLFANLETILSIFSEILSDLSRLFQVLLAPTKFVPSQYIQEYIILVLL